jgi:hypothetical protein
MQVSAEIRWFWEAAAPGEVRTWFTGGPLIECPPGGGSVRTDAYLHDPHQDELGIKLRGGNSGNKPGVEIKGLVASIQDGCRDRPFDGPLEIWTKWSSAALSLTGVKLTRVNKRRWLRIFHIVGDELREIALDADEHPIDEPGSASEGCILEYTEVSVEGFAPWTTLGFEAFGSLQTVAGNLRLVTARLAQRSTPTLAGGWCASYPVWLQRVLAQSRD